MPALETRMAEVLNTGARRYAELAQIARGVSRVTTGDTSLVSTDGASLSTSVYALNVSTGDVLLAGVHGTIAAETDTDILLETNACDLNGAAPAAVEDGFELVVAICAILVNGAPELAYVFGDPVALAATPVAPTPDQCRIALGKLGITDHLESGVGIVVGNVTFSRNTTMTLTHSDPATEDAVKAERLAGALAA